MEIKTMPNDLKTYMKDGVRSWRLLGQTVKEGFQYLSAEDYVADKGRAFDSAPLTDEEREVVLAALEPLVDRGYFFAPKQCFHNSQLLKLSDRSGLLTYVEGFAFSGLLPVHHAWLTINGKVVDTTRRIERVDFGAMTPDEFADHLDGEFESPEELVETRVVGEIPSGWIYFGVGFPDVDLYEITGEFEETHALIGDYRRDFPHLREDRITPLPDISKEKEALDKIRKTVEGLS